MFRINQKYSFSRYLIFCILYIHTNTVLSCLLYPLALNHIGKWGATRDDRPLCSSLMKTTRLKTKQTREQMENELSEATVE